MYIVIPYLIVLIAQIACLILCARKHSVKGWILLYLFEAVSAVIAYIVMLHYNNLPGFGMAPGLTYFAETLYSLFAAWVYGAMLVITAIVNALVYSIRKAKT